MKYTNTNDRKRIFNIFYFFRTLKKLLVASKLYVYTQFFGSGARLPRYTTKYIIVINERSMKFNICTKFVYVRGKFNQNLIAFTINSIQSKWHRHHFHENMEMFWDGYKYYYSFVCVCVCISVIVSQNICQSALNFC